MLIEDAIAKISSEINVKIDTIPKIDVFTSFDAIPLILSNLISNAYKYSELEKFIHVSFKIENDSLIIICKDRGIGIGKNETRNIFKPFYRLEKTKSGSGLGKHGMLDIGNEWQLGESLNILSQMRVG